MAGLHSREHRAQTSEQKVEGKVIEIVGRRNTWRRRRVMDFESKASIAYTEQDCGNERAQVCPIMVYHGPSQRSDGILAHHAPIAGVSLNMDAMVQMRTQAQLLLAGAG